MNGMNHVLHYTQAIPNLLLTVAQQGLQIPCWKELHPWESPQEALSLLWTHPMQHIPLRSLSLPSHPPCLHVSNSKLLLQHGVFTAKSPLGLFLIRKKTTHFALVAFLETARLVLAAIVSKMSSDADT